MSEEYTGRKFSCIFIDGLVPDQKEILSIGKRIASEGASGNISQRLPEGILITAGGSVLSSLSHKDIVLVVSFEDNIARTIGSKEPSSELPLHSMLYSSFDPKAIIHVHDPALLSNADKLGIPVARFAPYGTSQLAENACSAMSGSNIIALESHGILSAGDSLEHALSLIIEKRKLL